MKGRGREGEREKDGEWRAGYREQIKKQNNLISKKKSKAQHAQGKRKSNGILIRDIEDRQEKSQENEIELKKEVKRGQTVLRMEGNIIDVRLKCLRRKTGP